MLRPMRPGVYALHSISPVDRPSTVSQKLLSRPDRMAAHGLGVIGLPVPHRHHQPRQIRRRPCGGLGVDGVEVRGVIHLLPEAGAPAAGRTPGSGWRWYDVRTNPSKAVRRRASRRTAGIGRPSSSPSGRPPRGIRRWRAPRVRAVPPRPRTRRRSGRPPRRPTACRPPPSWRRGWWGHASARRVRV